jgi:UDPglucose 6-dehydrogenase
VVDKSTVPVGTARNVKKIISELNPDADFDVASNPEFLREGAAISDFLRPDRIVIGVENKRSENLLRELYRPINLIESPIISTDLESAELIKYASNAFLATKISFINEMSMICEKTGADIHAVAKGMGLDGRIGGKFLHPGPGYGGSCLPKDTKALSRIAYENGISSRIVETVIEVNEIQKMRMIEKIYNALGKNVDGKKIAVLGLTFKPETDDMRDAPSLTILPKLIEKGIKINTHDPKGMEEAKKILPSSVQYFDDIYKSMDGVDAVVLMTEWNIYRNMDMFIVKEKLNTPVFIDLRNVYEPKEMKEYGFDYFSVGR